METPPRLVVTIDDDPTLCELLQELLRSEGYRAECYPDGPSGLARIAAGGVALVLVDWLLPGMSGAETLQGITTGPSPTPVVVMTAMGHDGLPATPPGAVAVVQKPFDLDELLALVARYGGPAS